MNNLLCCAIDGRESAQQMSDFTVGETSCIQLTFYLVGMRDSKTHLPWRLDGTTKEREKKGSIIVERATPIFFI